MQVGIFLFILVIAALNDYVIVASIIVIAIRNSINCAALIEIDIFYPAQIIIIIIIALLFNLFYRTSVKLQY